ncbi:hypothetical protein C8R45DRAFT_312650 [Mycena sanguinolenta]|nr:hypothetical protein C8R45DRAFT_312650 [Mycena sanguinolenta]
MPGPDRNTHEIIQLHGGIANLNAEIELQTALLNNLERKKSLMRRQLNAVFDPVARLPLEISSYIFLQCLDSPKLGLHDIPLLFLCVCHAWAEIALATPALWTAIHITFPCAEGSKDALSLWLGRARNRPLSISLEGIFDQDIISVIWHHGKNLKHLEMCSDDPEGPDGVGDESARIWGDIGLAQLPSLETLTIITANQGRSLFLHDMIRLLHLAPNLTELALCHWIGRDVVDDEVVLPKLRRLTFGDQDACPTYDDAILTQLTLPALEALFLPVKDGLGHNLLSFLRRSSPPLRKLVLGRGLHSADTAILVDCLRLVPNLRLLELWRSGSDLWEALFAALVAYPSPMVPHLETIVLHLHLDEYRHDRPISNSPWWAARRRQFQLIHIMVHCRGLLSVPEFREVVEGTEVRISVVEEIRRGW